MQIGPTLQSHIADMFINSGEAAYRVDTSRAQQMPDIPWRKVIGLRHILAHGYEQVAHEILFKTIADDLPTLEAAALRRRSLCQTSPHANAASGTTPPNA